MSPDYENHLARIREAGRRTEELFRVRYASGLPAAALRLAERWRAALSSDALDWTELSAIRSEAREMRMAADVAFLGFINDLERDSLLLRHLELESSFGG